MTRLWRWGTVAAPLLATLAGACDAPARRTDVDAAIEQTVVAVEGPIVATVDGEPIALREVEALVRTSHLDPREALRRLEAERAVARHAEASGLAADPRVRGAMRRAMVEALIEREVAEAVESVPPAMLEARIASDRGRFVLPEVRRTTHVLARLDGEGITDADRQRAEAYLEGVRGEMTTRPPEDVLRELRDAPPTGLGFDVIVEDLDVAREDHGLQPSFADAVNARTTPGLVDGIVHSSYGLHLVDVRAIDPRMALPDEDVRRIVGRQVLLELRAARLDAVEQALAERIGIAFEPEAAARLATIPAEGAP